MSRKIAKLTPAEVTKLHKELDAAKEKAMPDPVESTEAVAKASIKPQTPSSSDDLATLFEEISNLLPMAKARRF